MNLKKRLRNKNIMVVPLKKNKAIALAKFGKLEKRSLTAEEIRRLDVLEVMGIKQNVFIRQDGPLTYIEAGGLVGQENWLMIIHHQEDETPMIYFAPNLGVFNGMDWGQLELDDE